MFSLILGFIIGCVATVFLCVLGAPFAWRRALFLARKVVRSELPLSLKEIEADRDFLRARRAVDICRLQDELDEERRADHQRKLALSYGREQLNRQDRLQAECEAQAKKLAAQEKTLAALAEKNRALKEKAAASLKLKTADLAEFRRQIKQIAAQTAAFIATEEGIHSPIMRLVQEEGTGAGRGKSGLQSEVKQGETLAAAIKQTAEKTMAAKAASAAKPQAKAGRRKSAAAKRA